MTQKNQSTPRQQSDLAELLKEIKDLRAALASTRLGPPLNVHLPPAVALCPQWGEGTIHVQFKAFYPTIEDFAAHGNPWARDLVPYVDLSACGFKASTGGWKYSVREARKPNGEPFRKNRKESMDYCLWIKGPLTCELNRPYPAVHIHAAPLSYSWVAAITQAMELADEALWRTVPSPRPRDPELGGDS